MKIKAIDDKLSDVNINYEDILNKKCKSYKLGTVQIKQMKKSDLETQDEVIIVKRHLSIRTHMSKIRRR